MTNWHGRSNGELAAGRDQLADSSGQLAEKKHRAKGHRAKSSWQSEPTRNKDLKAETRNQKLKPETSLKPAVCDSRQPFAPLRIGFRVYLPTACCYLLA